MSEQVSGRHPPRIWAQFAAVTLIWGSTFLVIKSQISTVPPSWSVTWRFAIAAVVLAGFCLARGDALRLPRRGHLFALAVGALQFCVNFNLVYRAELHIASGLVAIGFALLMMTNALLAWAVLRRPVSQRFLVGCGIGLAGVLALFARELRSPTAGSDDVMLGLSLFAGALAAATIANVMQASETARRLPALPMLAWAMSYGALLNFAVALAVAGPPTIDWSPQYLAGLLFLGALGSSVAFAFYFSMIRAMGPAEAAWSSVLSPVVALALSTLFEGYRWSPLAVVGAVLAISGLVIALRPPRRVQSLADPIAR